MKDGFIKVSAVTPKIKVADPVFNGEQILSCMKEEWKKHTKICVFPELCITAYTCNDLFLQKELLDSAKETLRKLVQESRGHDMMTFLGIPWEHEGKLYNAAACLQNGELLGLIPKTYLPNYGEFYEDRYFTIGPDITVRTDFFGKKVPFGTNLLFKCSNVPALMIAGEICEDVWVPNPPSISHAMAGATVIVNPSASDELVGKNSYRDMLIIGQSARLVAAYIYANAGEGESTQDLVFGGHDIIAENGRCLAESARFKPETITADIDVQRIFSERRKLTTYDVYEDEDYETVEFSLKEEKTRLSGTVDPAPFVPSDESEKNRRCEEILSIQALGLKKRLEHVNGKCVVLGLSGGLDSTLALLVCAKAFDMLKLPKKGIHAVTMPCFGTTDRTYRNACELAKCTGASLSEIRISEAVNIHFRDIGQDPENHDVTYENAQARERTQVLMDIANRDNGLVVGTGDLSELALGWATYNGDHMSMYAVNSSVPKTLVRHLVRYYADTCGEKKLKDILYDVLDTPVSPELLPPEKGKISQKTEDLVGPYELHDFFLYYVLRFGFKPSKIYRLAETAFRGRYDSDTIYRWMQTFYRRFFSQQFKRSCLPDGPKVGSIAVSPRGDLRMPSDAVSRIWLDDLMKVRAGSKK
jgi:NAD+ synthase (glutamine-hydrolysing)